MLSPLASHLFDQIARHMSRGADDVVLEIPVLLSVRALLQEHRQEVVEHLARYIQLETGGAKTVRIWSRRPRLGVSDPILTPVVCNAATAYPIGQTYSPRPQDLAYELWVTEDGDHVRLFKRY